MTATSRLTIAALLLLGLVLADLGPPGAGAARTAAAADAGTFAAALESIRTEDLKRHAAVLASDTFEGREAGTQGGIASGAYLVSQLRNMRVMPAGEDGDFYQYFGEDYRNILALVPGSDPQLKDEYILVTAHYDHVGLGTARNSRGPIGQIHNGADDNASGTAALVELAEALTALDPAPRRSVLFILWDGEEKGLLGSEHWVRHPTVPLEKIRLLINADMVGRMRENLVEVYGARTAPGLRFLVSEANDADGPRLDFVWLNRRDSDHYPFYERRIPFLMLHTRKHDDYHRPSDDVDRLNFDGMQIVSRMLFRLVFAAAHQSQLPAFREAVFHEGPDQEQLLESAAPPWTSRLGVAWEQEATARGPVRVASIDAGSPAQAAGLQHGDLILEFDGHRLLPDDDLRGFVLAARDRATIVVQSAAGGEPRRLTVRLAGEPLRFGFSWKKDEAEPGAVLLNRVAPGSPADRAGLRVGDRLYAIDGRPFTSEEDFRRRITSAPDEVQLLAERDGRLRHVRLTALRATLPTADASEPADKPAPTDADAK